MLTTCEAQLQPALPTLVIRSQTPVERLPETLGQSYGKIFQHLGALGEAPAGPPFVAYYNMDMQNLDIEAGAVVARPLEGKEEIQAGTLPAGMVATCTFTGPYLEMGPAYEELTRWVQENGHQASGVVYEFYLNSPAEVPPEALQTRIVFVLK